MSRSTNESRASRVGIVVLNWHRRGDTLECLRALRGLVYPSFFVVLIDNGCEEFSAEELARLADDACYLRTPENLGFAGGSNLGMREALRRGAEYVWFLNNDAAPEPDALRELIAVAEGEARPAIVGAKILSADDPTRLDSIALGVDLRFGRVLLVGHDELDRGQYDGLVDPAAVTGCAMLVSRAACERSKGFDESFFAYLEDADLCLRARALGLGVAVAPRARVLHKRPTATGARQSTLSLYYATRNHLTLVDRHGRGPRLRRRILRALVVAYNVAYALRGGGSRSERVRAVWRGARGRSPSAAWG